MDKLTSTYSPCLCIFHCISCYAQLGRVKYCRIYANTLFIEVWECLGLQLLGILIMVYQETMTPCLVLAVVAVWFNHLFNLVESLEFHIMPRGNSCLNCYDTLRCKYDHIEAWIVQSSREPPRCPIVFSFEKGTFSIKYKECLSDCVE